MSLAVITCSQIIFFFVGYEGTIPDSEVKNGSGKIQGCMQINISNIYHVSWTFSPFTANQGDLCLIT